MPDTKSAVKRKTTVASGGFVQSEFRRLSDPDMRSAMTSLKTRISDDPKFGKSLLQQAGIVTAKGNLKKSYGG